MRIPKSDTNNLGAVIVTLNVSLEATRYRCHGSHYKRIFGKVKFDGWMLWIFGYPTMSAYSRTDERIAV